MAGTTKVINPGTPGAKIKKSSGAGSKIALANLIPVDAPPEKSPTGRRSAMRDIADQLAILENQGKWFKVGSGKRTNAYQMRKRLQDILGKRAANETGKGVAVEVRGIDAETADVYANYTA